MARETETDFSKGIVYAHILMYTHAISHFDELHLFSIIGKMSGKRYSFGRDEYCNENNIKVVELSGYILYKKI